MAINKKLFWIYLFIFAVGLCAGSFFEVSMTGAGKDQLMDALSGFFTDGNNAPFISDFSRCAGTWLMITVILFVTPFFPPLVLCGPLICLAKGLSVGFSAAMLAETFGLKGGWYILSTLVSRSLIQIPLMCVMAAFSAENAAFAVKALLAGKRRLAVKNALRRHARHYLMFFSVSAALLAVSCVIEALLN